MQKILITCGGEQERKKCLQPLAFGQGISCNFYDFKLQERTQRYHISSNDKKELTENIKLYNRQKGYKTKLQEATHLETSIFRIQVFDRIYCAR